MMKKTAFESLNLKKLHKTALEHIKGGDGTFNVNYTQATNDTKTHYAGKFAKALGDPVA